MEGDTDRETRLERIRMKLEQADKLLQPSFHYKHDVDWLLSEIDRLRKVEEAAREVDFHSANDSACTCSVVGRFCWRCEAFVRLSRALDRETP